MWSWLILNVGQKMRLHILLVGLVYLTGCQSGSTPGPVYGLPVANVTEAAQFIDSATKGRILKDRFHVSKVDGREVGLSPRIALDAVDVRSGRHSLELRFFGYRGALQSQPVEATVSVNLDIDSGKRYTVRGEAFTDYAELWIEDVVAAVPVTEKVSAALKQVNTRDRLTLPISR
jgi:hypothetical protein